MSATGNDIPALTSLAAAAKKLLPGVPVIAGGYCSLEGEAVLRSTAVDVVVVGEGEETAPELVKALLSGAPLDDVPGIIYRSREATRRTAPRSAPRDLDRLSPPTYWHLPPDAELIRVYASRGCPYDCSFCEIKDFYGRGRIRYHGREYIRKLVSGLVRLHEGPVRHLYFNDDEFLLDPGHLDRMAAVARELGLRICFQTRTRDVVRHQGAIQRNADTIHQVHMGVESFSQGQLERWSKRVSVEVNREALDQLAALGVSYYPYIILTDARTTVAELRETCEGLSRMPRCPYELEHAGRHVVVEMSPLERGIHLNRLKTFEGLIERDSDSWYLDAVWRFLSATSAEAKALRRIAAAVRQRGEQFDPCMRGALDLIEERILMLPVVAERAQACGSSEGGETLATEDAAAFNERSRVARAEYLTQRLLSAGSTAAPLPTGVRA